MQINLRNIRYDYWLVNSLLLFEVLSINVHMQLVKNGKNNA